MKLEDPKFINNYLKFSFNNKKREYINGLINTFINSTIFVIKYKQYETIKKNYETNIDRESSEKIGGIKYRKTTIKKFIAGRDRVIYFGNNNKQYIKRNGTYIAIKDAMEKVS